MHKLIHYRVDWRARVYFFSTHVFYRDITFFTLVQIRKKVDNLVANWHALGACNILLSYSSNIQGVIYKIKMWQRLGWVRVG
jgi:5-hydroxyisourate hydrolase-like protein (transthyretin family)